MHVCTVLHCTAPGRPESDWVDALPDFNTAIFTTGHWFGAASTGLIGKRADLESKHINYTRAALRAAAIAAWQGRAAENDAASDEGGGARGRDAEGRDDEGGGGAARKGKESKGGAKDEEEEEQEEGAEAWNQGAVGFHDRLHVSFSSGMAHATCTTGWFELTACLIRHKRYTTHSPANNAFECCVTAAPGTLL